MDNKKIGLFIKEKRVSLGLTQKELANNLNITDKAISKWETGLGLPDISLLEPLSNILGVTVTEILNGNDIEDTIKLSDADNYIIESINYSKNRYKNTINKIITFLIIFIFLLLIILNIINIYNQNKKYDLNDIINQDAYQKMINEDIKEIKNNFKIIKNNQGKYSNNDYKVIITSINDIEKSIDNNILINYDGKALKINELLLTEYKNTINIPLFSLAYVIDNNIQDKEFLDAFRYAIVSKYSTYNAWDLMYKYQIYDLLYVDYIDAPYDVMKNKIYITISDIKFLKVITNKLIEVGDIYE